jgi:diguanylate cyclase (GGDEF)-like protein
MWVVTRMREAWWRPSRWNVVLATAQVVVLNDLISGIVSQAIYRGFDLSFEPGLTRNVVYWAPIAIPTLAAPLTAIPRLRLSHRLQEAVDRLQEEGRERAALQAELEYQATHDALTGLLNRRGFHAASATALRDGAAVLVIDVNHFKSVNDTYGHSIGDEVLQAVGRALSTGHEDGVVGRTGGDEFVVLLPSGDLDTAERVRDRLQSLAVPLPDDGPPLTISASVGIGVVGPGESLDDALAAVDAAMYAAKRQVGSGR